MIWVKNKLDCPICVLPEMDKNKAKLPITGNAWNGEMKESGTGTYCF